MVKIREGRQTKDQDLLQRDHQLKIWVGGGGNLKE